MSMYEKFEHTLKDHATRLFGISYKIPGEQHILCTGMYEYQADFLVRTLETIACTNPSFYPRLPEEKDGN